MSGAIFSLPESQQFALAGGTALAEFYTGHRVSDDIDVFSFDPELVPLLGDRLAVELPRLLPAVSIERYRRYPTFQGLLIEGPDGSLKLDVGAGAAPQLGDFTRIDDINVLSPLDLFTDKLHALYGRRVARDAVDAWAIVTIAKQGIANLEPLVFAKDQGIFVDRLGWVDAFLAPTISGQLLPDHLRSMLRVSLDEATLRRFLESEAGAAARRIEIPSRAGSTDWSAAGTADAPPGTAEPGES